MGKHLRPIKPALKVGERVRVVLGGKEEVHLAKVVAPPDGDFITVRTVKVLVDGEKTSRKVSLDRIVGRE